MIDNNILIGAEGLDGANFLAACLTMSNEVYFNKYNLKQKVEYFFKGMSDIEKKNDVPIWSDVSMLFNSCARVKNKISFSTYQSKSVYESYKLNSNSKICISKVRLPIFWPLKIQIEKKPDDPIVKLFESKYFIGLINPDLFISLRTVLIDPNVVDFSSLNTSLLTVGEFNLLPKEVQESVKYKYQSNIERLFKCDIPINHKWHMANMECDLDFMDSIKKEHKNINFYRESNELLKNKITHEWDCNWFLTEEETVEHIKVLYSEMNLGKCNEELIKKMHRIWIRRIDHIKRSYLKQFNITSININTFMNE